ncbi:MAG: ABC transporter substrate-binding protein [Rhodopila sp.]
MTALHISRRAILTATAGASLPWRARAAERPVLRLGVLTDLSGPYSDTTGAGSVLGARMAAEDAMAADPSLTIEIVAGDMQNKPDVGMSIARQWIDREDVSAIIDVPNSAVALAVAGLAREKNRVALFSGAATSELTGGACGPNHIQWTHDTYGIPNAVIKAVVGQGGTSWFFVAANYTFGAALEADSRRFVERAGGTVLGSVRYPFPETTDFSSYLLQAQASGAKVIGFAMSGQDVVNCVKQAAEFGIGGGRGPSIAGLAIMITTVAAIGLPAAQGMLLAEPFYWDLNDGTRAFSARFGARNRNVMPTMNQAGCYGAVWHYLKAARTLGLAETASNGAAAVAAMKRIPTEDPLFGQGYVRADGRVIHDIHLFRVKAPAQSHGPWDLYEHVNTVPGEDAFRPLADGGCAMVGR